MQSSGGCATSRGKFGALSALVAALPGEIATAFHGVIHLAVGHLRGQARSLMLGVDLLFIAAVRRPIERLRTMLRREGRTRRSLNTFRYAVSAAAAGAGEGNCEKCESGCDRERF